MFGQKCPRCKGDIKKKFNFCPYCGLNVKKERDNNDFGMLGKNDMEEADFGVRSVDRMIGSLIKPLMKQFEKEIGKEIGSINIQISTPQKRIQQVNPPQMQINTNVKPTDRKNVKKEDAESKIRRLGDRIIYEIKTPNVNSTRDISISRLENGIEIKAYSKDKCYIKTIPLNLEILKYYLKDGMLFVEFKA